MKSSFAAAVGLLHACHYPVASFVAPRSTASLTPPPSTACLAAPSSSTTPDEDATATTTKAGTTKDDADDIERRRLKTALLGRLRVSRPSSSSSSSFSSSDVDHDENSPSSSPLILDPIFVDPITKDPLRAMSFVGPILGGGASMSGIGLSFISSTDPERVYGGRTDTYIDLLEPATSSSSASIDDDDDDDDAVLSSKSSPILSTLLAFVPPPLRTLVANATNSGDYIPMRDLFTSPSVSFAYERGWRQGFAAAGFPGADVEFDMANEHFAPVVCGKGGSVLVDMSCATGLFTRRFAKSEKYSRVIACDYSDSMLVEARRRILADSEILSSSTKLDLVRCDVAKIPLRSDSVDAFHAGAAMHCWPEIESSLKEIHRVLVPGGRYFATTFLSNYFAGVAGVERGVNGGSDLPRNVQSFQYFPSVEYLRDLLTDAGFEESKVSVELLGRACVVMRCEK
ncbi:hypothetical protein ACHAXA_002056 [Cyclostephanos tholiformis]|uniref:Methyltransferase type 11 domain-containing protein n=1 Tax=Cyclostephanos tholiformis TaxID=382380 RepID=A0ABD3SSG6_9STRA